MLNTSLRYASVGYTTFSLVCPWQRHVKHWVGWLMRWAGRQDEYKRGWSMKHDDAVTLGRRPPAAAAAAAWQQDRFAISFWVDPIVAPAEFDARYAEVAGANFTVVLGNFFERAPLDEGGGVMFSDTLFVFDIESLMTYTGWGEYDFTARG
jgi:hypothetical protein